jgi:hypothetical protein
MGGAVSVAVRGATGEKMLLAGLALQFVHGIHGNDVFLVHQLPPVEPKPKPLRAGGEGSA